MKSRTRFLVVGPARSGTTAVYQMIRQHPMVSALAGELRFARLAGGLGAYTVKGYTSETGRAIGHRVLFDALTTIDGPTEPQACGAKSVCNSANAASQYLKVLRTNLRDVRVILVRRSDLVAHWGSRRQKWRTGVAHAWQAKPARGEVAKLALNRFELCDHTVRMAETFNVLQQLRESNEVLNVSYEEFASDPEPTYHEILRFLDLPIRPYVDSAARKLLPPPRDYIKNYDRLAKLAVRIEEEFVSDNLPLWKIRAIKVGAYCSRKSRYNWLRKLLVSE